jgi:hypothetical protein
MYEISKLEELAADEIYVTAVRSFTARLFAEGCVGLDDGGVRHLQPLTRYGPACAGTALRLLSVPRFANLDDQLAGRWAVLVERVRSTKGASMTEPRVA